MTHLTTVLRTLTLSVPVAPSLRPLFVEDWDSSTYRAISRGCLLDALEDLCRSQLQGGGHGLEVGR